MYIGYGVDNASVHFDSGSADGEKFESDDPVGDCLVGAGSDPKLYSVHDLKHDLVGSSAKRIITTLDCCRTKRTERGRLKMRRKSKVTSQSISCQLKSNIF